MAWKAEQKDTGFAKLDNNSPGQFFVHVIFTEDTLGFQADEYLRTPAMQADWPSNAIKSRLAELNGTPIELPVQEVDVVTTYNQSIQLLSQLKFESELIAWGQSHPDKSIQDIANQAVNLKLTITSSANLI